MSAYFTGPWRLPCMSPESSQEGKGHALLVDEGNRLSYSCSHVYSLMDTH